MAINDDVFPEALKIAAEELLHEALASQAAELDKLDLHARAALGVVQGQLAELALAIVALRAEVERIAAPAAKAKSSPVVSSKLRGRQARL